MKFVWYDKSYTKASYRSLDNALLNSHFTLFLFKPIKRGKLEELDDYLEYQDQKMERLNLSYTKEHSEYLKENCEKVLEALLKSTIVNILTESNLKNESTIKNRVIESERFDFETFSKDFTLDDIRNISKTEKLVHPSERLRERHDEEEDYDEEDFKTRVEDFLKKGDIKILREDVDTDYEPNKIKFIIRIPHGSENDIGSKRYWYQKNGYEYKENPPTGRTSGTAGWKHVLNFSNREKFEGLRLSQFQAQIESEGQKGKEKKDSEKNIKTLNEDLIEILKGEIDIGEMLIDSVIDNDYLLNKNALYDLTFEVTLDKLDDSELYQTDEEGEFILEADEKVKLEEYKDIPEGDMRNINIEITYEKIKDITSEIKEDYGKLKVGEVPNVGEEKTIRGEKGEKIYAQPTTEKVNVARDSYLKFVRARLNDLEDAIRNIPDGE